MGWQPVLAVLSGSLVGFSLGLIGAGGSMLAVPLLLYVVGVRSTHVAIGTSAVAVAVNALLNLLPHARAGHVRWRPTILFALIGVLGVAAGTTLGKRFDGARLLALFAGLMILMAVLLQRPLPLVADPAARRPRPLAVGAVGFATGALAGFFGIGGGFLVVPALHLAARLSMIEAIGSSLLAVATFGTATAVSYAISGLVDWRLAAEFVAGGVVGGLLGARLAHRLAGARKALNWLFGLVLLGVAGYILVRGAHTG